jgi:hypothetical protein
VILVLAWLLGVTLAPDVSPPLRCLVESYPGALCGATANELLWCDGLRMPFRTERKPRTHQQRLDHADLFEQMLQVYTPFGAADPPPMDFEPGRIRNEAFFAKLYGKSRIEVAAHLKAVTWLDGTVLKVQERFGAAKQLRAVVEELRKLPKEQTFAVQQTAGTFVWRKIHGTDRRSAHSFATAIDVGVPVSDYWQWKTSDPTGQMTYRNRLPLEVVRVFEKHGFIWGGRWFHFDTMHFEYRPELLHPACVGDLARP